MPVRGAASHPAPSPLPPHAAQYLRGRSNTIRCVIEGLTDRTGENELARELVGAGRAAKPGRTAPLVQMAVHDAGRGDDALVATDFGDTDEGRAQWRPEPTDADPSLPFRARHTTDLLARVIGIFRSQEARARAMPHRPRSARSAL